MEIVSSPLHPELTWRRLNPALTKFSSNFLTLIDFSHASQSLSFSMHTGIVSAACSSLPFPAVGLVIPTDSVCLRPHAGTEQHPRTQQL